MTEPAGTMLAAMHGYRGGAFSLAGFLGTLLVVRHYGRGSDTPTSERSSTPITGKPRVDRAFLRRVLRLTRIMVPGWLTPEAGWLAAVGGMLLLRTYMDLTMLELTTSIERAIVERHSRHFGAGLRAFAKMMVPLSIVNAALKYGQAEVALRFRQRLSTYIMDR